ncbi:MAG TPA: SDR family NAD(P)-dependent oxidoreductase, partial [Candidatus Limnocylindria bacterium]|nr:SDR family NAD(P)-dependent oxidoreductase [Candidatus Limnocylindria bacterium]
MRIPLGDQAVVITGASSGIGRETALQMAREGAQLVLAARNQEALEELAREVERLGGEAEVVLTDVAEFAQVQRLGERAVERFGRIDTWVNDAAVSVYATVEQMTPDELERVIAVNLLGQMYGCKVAVGHMKPRRSGRIINVGSALSERAVPLQSAYVASKHGVLGLVRAAAAELARTGVTVNAVCPGYVDTPMTE